MSHRVDSPDNRRNANIVDDMATVDKNTCYRLYFIYLVRELFNGTRHLKLKKYGHIIEYCTVKFEALSLIASNKQDTIAVHCDYAEAVYVHDPMCWLISSSHYRIAIW